MELSEEEGDESKTRRIDFRRRHNKKFKRVAVDGLCLFCNANFPRDHRTIRREDALLNVCKFKRSFAYLVTELGVQIQDKNKKKVSEFSFISEKVPLCLECEMLLNQVNTLFLKMQSAKQQLNDVVKKIRRLVISSKSKMTRIYTEVEIENESHFNAFRRQVQVNEESAQHPCDLNISLPDVKVTRLKPAEIEQHCQRRNKTTIHSSSNLTEVDEFNLSTLVDDGPDDVHYMDDFGSPDDDIDIKPEVSDLERILVSSEDLITRESPCASGIELTNCPVKLTLVVPEKFEVITPAKETILDDGDDEESIVLDSNHLSVCHIEVIQEQVIPEQTPTTELIEMEPSSMKKKRQRTIYPKAPDEDSCKLCNIFYKNQKQLADHYKAVHPDEFPRKCPHTGCDYGTHFPNQIRKHILLKHAPEEERERKKNISCEQCGKKFFCRKNYTYHIRMHSGERPFTCSECGKGFRSYQAMDVHKFRIHENVRNFTCPHCPWAFKDKVSLTGHIAIHTGEKNHVCHLCGLKTIHKHALTSHWNVHKKKGDWIEPPDFNKRRAGWVIKSRKKPQPRPPTPIQTESQLQSDS